MTGPAPGLQPERTLLAWRRTALGLVANGILLVASGRPDGRSVGWSGGWSDGRAWAGIAVIGLALCCWAAVGAVYRRGGPPPVVLGRHAVPWLAGVLVLGVGLLDLYAVVTA